jgi:ribonuclease D
MKPKINLHQGDLPSNVILGDVVAIDTETMGLNPFRDRLCLVQLSGGDGVCHLVQLNQSKTYKSPNLIALLSNKAITKIFHYGRFDIAVLKYFLKVLCAPVYCTKIASKLARTFTDRHGLKDLCRDILNIEISKQAQTSDWGATELTDTQKIYAATDVLYLHMLKKQLDEMLRREGRNKIAQACFNFLPYKALLDVEGFADRNIFEH